MEPNPIQSCLNIRNSNFTSISQTAEQLMLFKIIISLKKVKIMRDPNSALQQLEKAKKIMENSMPSTESEKFCFEIAALSVLAYEIKFLWALKKYSQAKTKSQQTIKLIKNKNQFQIAAHIIFETKSILAMHYYNLRRENYEFQYPVQTQARFFFFLANIKIALNQTDEALLALKKIFDFQKTIEFPQEMKKRIQQILAYLDGKNKTQREKQVKLELDFFSQMVLEFKGAEKRILNHHSEKENSMTKQNLFPLISIYLRWIYKKDPSIAPRQIQGIFSKSNQNSDVEAQKRVQTQNFLKQTIQFFAPIIKLPNILEKYVILLSFTQMRGLEIEKINKSTNKKEKVNTNWSSNQPNDKQKAEKILKQCENGSLLTKINFGNTDRSQKFVRISEKSLKWSESEKQIKESFSEIKWKHVLGIVFGKVTSNLNKKAHFDLEPWKCFSLVTEDRSYDFYCNKPEQIFFWLQGISYKLQRFYKSHEKYPFYSKGRALWKISLMKMKYYYLKGKNKYKNKNCGGVICFKKEMLGNGEKKK